MKYLILLLLACCLVLSPGCSSGPTMAAGSSVTGSARVSGTVSDKQGIPLKGITVFLRSVKITAAGDSIVVEKHALTGAGGLYSFDSLRPGRYAVLCSDSAGGRSALRQRSTVQTDSEQVQADLVLRPEIVVKGRIIPTAPLDLKSMVIEIPALGKTFYPDSAGFYTLYPTPRGACDIAFIAAACVNFLSVDFSAETGDSVFINDVQFAVTQAAAQGIEDYYANSLSGSFAVVPVEAQAQALLFDDFESPLVGGVARNAIYDKLPLPGGAGSGQWVVRPNADGHIVTPAVFPSGFDSCMVTDGSFHGKSLRIFIHFNQGQPPTGGIGVDICTPHTYYDLSKMAEFSFYAKGSGRHRVVFHTDTVEYGEGEFIYEFTIPPAWQRISIKPADLVPNPGTQTAARGVTWQSASRGVTSISFFALTDDTLYMDDMYMFGIAASDIAVTSPGNTMP